MTTKRLVVNFILILGLLLTMSVGLSGAQEAQDNPPPADPASVSAPVSPMIPVQGRLTNAKGSPLNGDYNLTLRVYEVQIGGTPTCADSQLVSVKNGLFNTAIEGCTPSEIDGQQLYLGVEVESDGEMMPRQPLFPAPYAFSLVQGAALRGNLGGQPMLTVANKAGPAIRVVGPLQSSDATYLFIPGSAIVNVWNNSATDISVAGGAAMINKNPAGTSSPGVALPITIPGMMYGQPVRITEVRIYYVCEYPSSYISHTTLHRQIDATTYDNLINYGVDQNSTLPISYAPPVDTSYNTLSAMSGPLTLRLEFFFANNTSYIQIGMVRLTLEHDD
jgi:hypothetical protein